VVQLSPKSVLQILQLQKINRKRKTYYRKIYADFLETWLVEKSDFKSLD